MDSLWTHYGLTMDSVQINIRMLQRNPNRFSEPVRYYRDWKRVVKIVRARNAFPPEFFLWVKARRSR
jgi:hypothetical protein